MNAADLGKSFKSRREFLRLNQSDLAEMSGVTIKTIHLIESATGNPSLETMEKIARVLGMELLLQVKQPN